MHTLYELCKIREFVKNLFSERNSFDVKKSHIMQDQINDYTDRDRRSKENRIRKLGVSLSSIHKSHATAFRGNTLQLQRPSIDCTYVYIEFKYTRNFTLLLYCLRVHLAVVHCWCRQASIQACYE